MRKVYLFLIQALMALGLVFAIGCSKDDGKENETPSGSLKVGQSYQGGIIAYIDETGKHGLIAAPEDQSPGIQWYEYGPISDAGVTTGATGTMVGTGKSNTEKIVQTQGQGNYAAKLCDDLVLKGYSDWYLPSINELDILYRNRNAIGMFYASYYWSSSEYSYYQAWSQNFSDGKQNYYNSYKITANRVRAIRAF